MRRPSLRIFRREGVHVVVVAVGALWSKKRIWQRYRFAVWYLKNRITVWVYIQLDSIIIMMITKGEMK